MPIAGLRSIEPQKVTSYLLNDTHPVGGPKSKFFKLFGFVTTRPNELESALFEHGAKNRTVSETVEEYGFKTVIECSIKSPDGRNPCIRSVWLKRFDSETFRLVSAYPTKRRGKDE